MRGRARNPRYRRYPNKLQTKYKPSPPKKQSFSLDDLGIGEREAEEIGIRLYKVGMPWPLDKEGVTAFGEDLDEILVVEEKRAVMENQIKEQLYNAPGEKRPRVVGKFDENREWLLPSMGDLTPGRIARVIAKRLAPHFSSDRIEVRLRELAEGESAIQTTEGVKARTPLFCSGCPHNSSTVVPEGSRALAGIGCHYMVRWMDRNSDTFSQMGGEAVLGLFWSKGVQHHWFRSCNRPQQCFVSGGNDHFARPARQGQQHLDLHRVFCIIEDEQSLEPRQGIP